MSKRETLLRLSTILAEMYDAKYAGVDAARFYRAQGLVDGYVRALCDLKVVGDAELVEFVNQEKRRAAVRADRRNVRTSQIQTAAEFA